MSDKTPSPHNNQHAPPHRLLFASGDHSQIKGERRVWDFKKNIQKVKRFQIIKTNIK